MRKILACAVAGVLASGCFGGGDPEVSPDPQNPRARCDSYAAQAIQAESPAVATTLAAQASQCYAELQSRR